MEERGFKCPIAVYTDLPDAEDIADEFATLATGLRKDDPNGGLISDAWKDSELAKNPDDFEKYGYTSFYNFNLALEKGFERVHELTVLGISKYLDEFAHTNLNFKLLNSWSSIYGRGHYIPEHIHSHSHFSVVFYADASEGTGEIVFRNPMYPSYGMMFTGTQAFFNDNTVVQPKKGMMIIFPSFVPHYTKRHMDDKERIIFSCNAQITDSHIPHQSADGPSVRNPL